MFLAHPCHSFHVLWEAKELASGNNFLPGQFAHWDYSGVKTWRERESFFALLILWKAVPAPTYACTTQSLPSHPPNHRLADIARGGGVKKKEKK